MKHVLKATVLALSAWAMVSPASAAEPFRIAHVTGFSGPLAAYAKQLSVGMEMGFEYTTKGTMEVVGRKIEIIDKDAQGDPARARALVAEAYAEGDAYRVVGPGALVVSLSTLPHAPQSTTTLIPK